MLAARWLGRILPGISDKRLAAASPLLGRWAVGILGSWLLVWLAGPLVLNTILVRVSDPDLEVNTLRPGDLIRWRSEGWGNTRTGPHGLPGWSPRPAAHRVILWGDSQVEGHCVNDPEKISNQVIALADAQTGLSLDCLPLGRSGADARDWRDLAPEADALWEPRLHLWVVTDLSDLMALAPQQGLAPYHRWTMESPRWVKLAAALRAEALFAAGKRLFRDPSTGGLRQLQFGIGPRSGPPEGVKQPWEPPPGSQQAAGQPQDRNGVSPSPLALAQLVAGEVALVADQLDGRLAILYAPAVPTLARPLATAHRDDAMFALLRDALRDQAIEVVDVRDDFIALWHSQRRLPRGFHNGQPGYGHLNAEGNRVVAKHVVSLIQEHLPR